MRILYTTARTALPKLDRCMGCPVKPGNDGVRDASFGDSGEDTPRSCRAEPVAIRFRTPPTPSSPGLMVFPEI